MSYTASQTLCKSGTTSVLRPSAAARAPFGTPFFTLLIDPDTDTGTFVKRPLDAWMMEEIRVWEKLQRAGKLPENRASAAVLQETPFSAGHDGDEDEAAGGTVGGGSVVVGAGYPTYFGPGVDGLQAGNSDSETTGASSSTSERDRLWPDTYSSASDSDIDYILDGFVVIDMADATGSVF